MKTWLAVGVALTVGVTPVFARGHSGGHGGGSHAGGHGGASHSGGRGHAHSGGGGSHASGGAHAHTRDGGSASSSHAGEHHGPGSSTADRSSSTSGAPRPLTDAERRHPRPGTGTGDRFFDGFGRGFYARPSFGFGLRYRGGYFDPFLYGYDYYGYSPWFYGDYGPYPSYRYQYDGRDAGEDENAPRADAEAATLRLDVRPPDASIYVDDQFRGTGRDVERLDLRVGQHRIEVVRPGYLTVARDVDLAPGEGRTLEIELEPYAR